MNTFAEKFQEFGGSLLQVLLVFLITLAFSCIGNFAAAGEWLEDQQGDLKICYNNESSCSSCMIRPSIEEMEDELRFIDILSASVEKTTGANSLLVMKLKVADSVPDAPRMLTSYSFALDLDGDPDTGFKADRLPLGVFPDLGVDLWVNLSLSQGIEDAYLFIGPKNIEDLKSTTGLLEYSYAGPERRTILFTVPLEPVESKLTFSYLHKKPLVKVDLEKIKWVSFTTRTTSQSLLDDLVNDFHPDKYFEESPEGCIIRLPASN